MGMEKYNKEYIFLKKLKKISSLINLEVYNTVVLTIITMLYDYSPILSSSRFISLNDIFVFFLSYLFYLIVSERISKDSSTTFLSQLSSQYFTCSYLKFSLWFLLTSALRSASFIQYFNYS